MNQNVWLNNTFIGHFFSITNTSLRVDLVHHRWVIIINLVDQIARSKAPQQISSRQMAVDHDFLGMSNVIAMRLHELCATMRVLLPSGMMCWYVGSWCSFEKQNRSIRMNSHPFRWCCLCYQPNVVLSSRDSFLTLFVTIHASVKEFASIEVIIKCFSLMQI